MKTGVLALNNQKIKVDSERETRLWLMKGFFLTFYGDFWS